MPPEENERIMRRYTQEVLNKGDMAAFEELVDPNYVDRSSVNPIDFLGLSEASQGPGAPKDRDRVKRGIGAIRKAVPDLTYHIDTMSSDGEQVTVQGTIHGTPTGKLMGKSGSGKPAKVNYTAHARIVNGKITEGYSEWDQEEVRRQLQG